MKKTLLQEVKAMNKIAGTQMTVEQEIAFIKNRLQELEFTHQASFDAYNKTHKMRPDTEVNIAGKKTTVKDASKEKGMLQKLGAKLFGKKEEPVQMPNPLDAKNPLNKSQVFDPKRGSFISIGKALENPEKYQHLAADVQSKIDTDPDGVEAKKKMDKVTKQKEKQKAKEKEYQQWRKDNPELAIKQDNDAIERSQKQAAADRERSAAMQKVRDDRNKRNGSSSRANRTTRDDDDDPFDSAIKMMKRRERDDDNDSGFGGFGGGSFGGGGASGDW